MRDPEEKKMDAYEMAHEQYIAAGKAKPIDYTKCPCGYHTHCIPKQNGNVWMCADPKCTEKPRFEEVKR